MNIIQNIDINEELTKLWNEEQGQNKIRASLFTLIVYLHKGTQANYYQNIIKSVVAKFPCRVILIISDVNADEDSLKTTVSSETIGLGELKIFCEIIQIEVARECIERVPFMVLPHILPDLPVYLLWTQDPIKENAVLPHLEPLADRIIFDSESTTDLQNYSCAVMSLMKCFHCRIGDLNWSALSGWRSLLARVFNNPQSLADLQQCVALKIYYNKKESEHQKHTEIEAAYLQAWLASRLNWKFQTILKVDGNLNLTYRVGSQDIEVTLIPQAKEAELPGQIFEVEIVSLKDEGHYIFKKQPNSRQVCIQYSEKDFCQLPECSYLSGTAAGQEIVEEIFYPSSGKHYKNMLEILSLIPWRSL